MMLDLVRKSRSYRRRAFARQDRFSCRRNGKEFFVGFVKEWFYICSQKEILL